MLLNFILTYLFFEDIICEEKVDFQNSNEDYKQFNK